MYASTKVYNYNNGLVGGRRMSKDALIKCPSCNGKINVNMLEDMVDCQYCGATIAVSELLAESDEIKSQKIQARAQRDIELGKQANEMKKMEEAGVKEKQQKLEMKVEKFKKSKLSIFILICAMISLFSIYLSFSNGKILAGLVAMVQAGLFIYSWLLGMQFIKEKKYNIHIIPMLVSLLLIIPFIQISMKAVDTSTTLAWSDIALSTYLPEPNSTKGEIHMNNNQNCRLEIVKVEEVDYNEYIALCQGQGFIVDSKESSTSYEAYNNEGYKLKVDYRTSAQEMQIQLEVPMAMQENVWPTSELAQLLPVPKSTIGSILYDRASELGIYLGQTSISDYNDYVSQCADIGFNIDYDKSEKIYSATNEEGYRLSVRYEGGNIMLVQLNEPKEEVDTSENESEEHEEEVEVSESTDTDLVDGMRPEFKEAIDAYEEFFDEYVTFMKKYSESGNELSMLTDYLAFLDSYAKNMEKLSELESQDLNDAELAYYTEAMVRINIKLLTVL